MDNECTHRRSWGRSIMRFKGNEAIPVNFPVKAEPKQRVHKLKPAVKGIEIREYTSEAPNPITGSSCLCLSTDVYFELKFPSGCLLRLLKIFCCLSALLSASVE